MLTIVWDVDDVLNDLAALWFAEAWLPGHPDCVACFDGLAGAPPEVVLGTTREAYLESLDAYRHSGAYASQPPRPDVLAWFEAHGGEARHLALTAVPLHAVHVSAEWVLRHYGRWIRGVHVVPSARPGDPPGPPERDKGQWLAWFGGADVLVDDGPENVTAALALGLRGLLFPRPWNADAGRPVSDLLEELTGLVRQPAHADPTATAACGAEGSS